MISVNGITKYYGGKSVVEKIGFSCGNGEVVSVIGPNGSGKSTLLKIMAGVLKADEGSVLVDGCDTWKYENRKIIGYMPDRTELARGLTVRNFLHMVSDYKYGGGYREDLERAVSAFGLAAYRDQAYHRLSMGNQRKVAAVAAFLGNPRLVILDEPTNGMDTAGVMALKQAVGEVRDRGGTVVMASHILDFAGSISDNNLFLKDGRLAWVEKESGRLESRYRMLYLEEKGGNHTSFG